MAEEEESGLLPPSVQREIMRGLELVCEAFAGATKSLQEDSNLTEEQDDTNYPLPPDSFSMAYLKEVSMHYEKSLKYFSSIHSEKASDLLESTNKGKLLGSGRDAVEINSTDFKLVCDNLQKWNEYMKSGICMVQLHNVEKRFGAYSDECRFITEVAKTGVEEEIKSPLPTLRQKFNSPQSFMKSKFFEKSQEKPRKKQEIAESLEEHKKLSTDLISDMKATNRLLPKHKARLPTQPRELVYLNLPLVNLTDEIRQTIDDLFFCQGELGTSKIELLFSRETLRNTLVIWAETSEISWEYGKKHVEQLPIVRRYEYQRTSYWALYISFQQSQRKILNYLQSEEYQKGTNPRFEADMSVDLTPAAIEDEWKARWQNLEKQFPTVPEIVQDIEELRAINRVQRH